ncbi:hypothetical protein BH09PLA1_BH09PLA1_32020 [soil metagenome]
MKLPIFAALLLLLIASPRLAAAGPTTNPSTRPATGLNVGQLAPEISGTDVHGKAMKLSDFRSKIVVIDFFGDW